MTTIRLINCFEVPATSDEEFLAQFREVNAYMAGKTGYLGHRLHRALIPEARYRFVNYVEWRSAEDLAAARDEQYRDLVRAVQAAGFRSTHASYDIVHQRSVED